MKNAIEFPLVNFTVLNHVTLSADSPASCNLCEVTDFLEPKKLDPAPVSADPGMVTHDNMMIKMLPEQGFQENRMLCTCYLMNQLL